MPTALLCQKPQTGSLRKNVVFGVIVGTGTGGGIVVHGKTITGANAIAGEWGHLPVAPRR